MLHEIGHTFGLGHSKSDEDVMSTRGHWGRYRRHGASFSPREELVMKLMWQRRAGTQFPDNDRLAATASRREVVILD